MTKHHLIEESFLNVDQTFRLKPLLSPGHSWYTILLGVSQKNKKSPEDRLKDRSGDIGRGDFQQSLTRRLGTFGTGHGVAGSDR